MICSHVLNAQAEIGLDQIDFASTNQQQDEILNRILGCDTCPVPIVIMGSVVNKISGKPVTGAVIGFSDSVLTFSGKGGVFSLALPDQDVYMLYVEHNDYLPADTTIHLSASIQKDIVIGLCPRSEYPNSLFEISNSPYEDDNSKTAEFIDSIHENDVLIGRIVNENNEPVAGAIITVLQTGATATTDKDGLFSFSVNKGSDYSITCAADGYKEKTSDKFFKAAKAPGNVATICLESEQQIKIVRQKMSLEENAGIISGRILDSRNEMPVPGASITLEDKRMYTAVSDVKGVFRFSNIIAGTYKLSANRSEYESFAIDPLTVADSEKTSIIIFLNRSDIAELQHMTVTANTIRNTDAALLKQRQEKFNISDMIGSDQMSKSGASTAADALKYVPGVTLADGKFPIVRGFGTRYINTLMNGIELPSPNPDEKAITFDLFPTGLLDNLTVDKAFAPDMPGNFAGGSIDIITKSLPEKFAARISASGGINSQTTFRDNFLVDEAGKLDWLGIDDGTRAIPDVLHDTVYNYGDWLVAPILDTTADPIAIINEADANSKAFETPFSPQRKTARPNQSYSFELGNTIDFFNRPLGFLAAITYSNKLGSYQNGINGSYVFDQYDTLVDTVIAERVFKDSKSKEDVLWGALFNTAYAITKSDELALMYMYTRQAENTARYQYSTYHYQISNNEKDHLEVREIKFIERGLHFGMISGSHTIKSAGDLQFDWALSGAHGIQNEPDYRLFINIIQFDSTGVTYNTTKGFMAKPSHRFRFTEELTGTAKFDLEIPFYNWANTKGLVKTGFYLQKKNRDFEQHRFYIRQVSPPSNSLTEFHGDINAFTSQSNMGLIGSPSDSATINEYHIAMGNTIEKNSSDDEKATYQGDQDWYSAYLMSEFPFFSNLRCIGGIRYEYLEISQKDTTRLHKPLWLPSVSLVYGLNESINLRAAYSRTYIAPNFRELAPYQTEDHALKEPQIGNDTLKISFTHNADLRWEWFLNPGEIIATSFFFKASNNPIAKVYIAGTNNNEKTWVNLDEQVKAYGVEFELKKGFEFIHPGLKLFSTGLNASIMHSSMKYPRRNDTNVGNTVPLWNASPYVINSSLHYDNEPFGISAGVFFIIFGKRLNFISDGSVSPDAYEMPHPELNIMLSKEFNSGISVKMKAGNLINPENLISHEYKDIEYFRSSYRKGRSYSIGLSYKF
ncbi:MAG: TonB-dependent receptor plug domain-containing protein [Candidatus Marinimicrobia bacterium]|nr:TonB-dependent receptor plug domain-containing protein [Candidatus Neomarinimicrobiota bacterium]